VQERASSAGEGPQVQKRASSAGEGLLIFI
jgi:hypothetical protein